MSKVLFLVADGMAGWPLETLGHRTTLEAAHTPTIDSLAVSSLCGCCQTVPTGMPPGSDVANMALSDTIRADTTPAEVQSKPQLKVYGWPRMTCLANELGHDFRLGPRRNHARLFVRTHHDPNRRTSLGSLG
jgi:hypothetical protein